MYYVGARQVLAGALTLGDLTVFTTYLLMLYQPLEQLSYTAWALEGAAAGAARCFEVLDREDDVPDAPNARPIANARGDIEFRNVSFGYSPDRLILKDVNLSIAHGESVAFVGGTGAGKSTLLSLVPRFYDPIAGGVFLDGRNVRDLTKKSLRAQIGMVLQDTVLFSTTIKENIAYGRPGATNPQIIEAAKRAQAYDFIMRMPQGFESAVGERGSHLSVGQRQRIGIARAFLKDAPILLLDEPTSALDPGTEHASHGDHSGTHARAYKRSSSLIASPPFIPSDVSCVLENGTIAEQGTGQELLANDGVYAKLYRAGQYEQGARSAGAKVFGGLIKQSNSVLSPLERRITLTLALQHPARPSREDVRFREAAWCGPPPRKPPCRFREIPEIFEPKTNARSWRVRCALVKQPQRVGLNPSGNVLSIRPSLEKNGHPFYNRANFRRKAQARRTRTSARAIFESTD